MQETKLMTSGDEQLVLTSQRLTETIGATKKEVLLKDIQKVKVSRKKQRYFVLLFLIFAVLLVVELIGLVIYSSTMKPEQHGDWQTMFMFTLVFFGLAVYFTFFTGQPLLRLHTKTGPVEMNLDVFYKEDVPKFVQRLKKAMENS